MLRAATNAALLAPALLAAALLVPAPLAPAAAADAPAIVGGTPVAPGEYPWQVAILFKDIPDNYDAQYCGGSLIAARWVLTSAYCIIEFERARTATKSATKSAANPAGGDRPSADGCAGTSPTPFAVMVGSRSLASGGRRIAVDKVVVHPNYDCATGRNDVALMRLAAPATQQTIGLVTAATAGSLTPPGRVAAVAGWGITDGDPERPWLLMEAQVPIVANAVCNQPDAYDGAVLPTMLCAGPKAGGKGFCALDEGGPLVVRDGAGGHVQAGIASWQYGCAEPGFYGVYQRVASFQPWITATAGLNVGTPTVVSPRGGAAVSGVGSRFVWSAAPGATSYRVQIVRGAFNRVETLTPAQAGCASGTGSCARAVPGPLAIGAGQWRVLARNAYGTSPWTALAAFAVSRQPGKPMPHRPAGRIASLKPTYTWSSVPDAAVTQYELLVKQNGKLKYRRLITAATAKCAGTAPAVCSFTPNKRLDAGPHNFFVRALNAAGFGPFSGGRRFVVAPPGDGEVPFASAAMETGRRALAWQASAGADAYEVSLVGHDGTPVFARVIAAGAAGCPGGQGECRLPRPGVDAVSWWVRAKGDAGWGPATGHALD